MYALLKRGQSHTLCCASEDQRLLSIDCHSIAVRNDSSQREEGIELKVTHKERAQLRREPVEEFSDKISRIATTSTATSRTVNSLRRTSNL